MDVDNENFYDEITSFLPQPGEYSLEDLEDIIRLTDSNLDASWDINAFTNDFDIPITESSGLVAREDDKVQQQLPIKNETEINSLNEYPFDFSAFSSPASSQQSVDFLSPYKTSVRTSSPTSLGEEHFNPDDFINFFNEDIKMDDFGTEAIMKLNENCRNTPSPTGSYTSSSGSSTSGVQSDASSVASMSQTDKSTIGHDADDDLLEFIKFKTEKSEQDIKITESSQQSTVQFDNEAIVVKQEDDLLTTPSAAPTLLPISVPVPPVTARQNFQPVNFVASTIIPIKTVPLTAITPVVNIKSHVSVKSENTPPLKQNVITKPVKLVAAANDSAEDVGTKAIPSHNAKPKTIYLSSNDFKVLMQKMSANGKKIVGANGQIPKVLMKTANGKIIAANTITNISKSNTVTSTVSPTASINSSFTTSASYLNSQSHQLSSKMVKLNSRSAAAMSASKAALNHSKSSRTDYGMLKGLNDDKLLKKQLRMLKNRESASLSRKKKKEYVERLENRISNLEKENYSLKGENSSLRSQLMAFAQTCSCKHGNVGEFILNTLNMDGKSDGAVLNLMNNAKRHLENCNRANNNNLTTDTLSKTHHIKIAPKPANAGPFINKGFKQRMNAATVKKNVAVLFAMAFMVTLNVSNFPNYLNKPVLENTIDTSATGATEEPVVQTGRRLLWVPNEHEFNGQTNRTKRDIEMANMPPPPLHFLRPINRTMADKLNGTSAKDEPPIKRSSTATKAIYANATQENMRLARNLHKWIGGNDYLNLTGTGIGIDFEDMNHFKFGSGSNIHYDLPLQAPIGMKQKRKIILDSQIQEKHTKLNIEGDHNSLDIFQPKISEEYLRLFKGIKRQDDTFYVLSFNMDHVLLPASAYNKSSRPKMSLMLPAGDPSHKGDIVLMQIDCEVINTTELEIKYHMIPEKLRPSKYSSNVRVNSNDVANNETTAPAVTKSKNFPTKPSEPPAPRTYLTMRPKTQSSFESDNSIAKGANIVKRKPTILKLHANDSVIGSGVLNISNSSLFSRMRDSVGSKTNGVVGATLKT